LNAALNTLLRGSRIREKKAIFKLASNRRARTHPLYNRLS